MINTKPIIVVGAGLAGCEASYQLANRGYKVQLYEMKPNKKSPAHKSDFYAELVCSNSLRSGNLESSSVGLMHQELRLLKSLILQQADLHKVPAGEALAVDRDIFSQSITEIINNHPNIEVVREEFSNLAELSKDNIIIVATGPLTSENLSLEIAKLIDNNSLNFFDAIAPVVYKDSIDFSKAWYQSRYDKGESKDYINCALNKQEYETFYNELINAQYMEFEEWEADIGYFEGCLPIEVMAKRGFQTLLFGCMKPVGLTPPSGEKPYAVIQLRQDNKLGTLYNIVGFQTKLKYGEQTRIFKLIPALANAEFAKLGSIHKNTFINSPKLLNPDLSLKNNPNIYFAGQITGCEGYVESTSVGLMSALFVDAKLKNTSLTIPQETSFGAMLNHITEDMEGKNYQPMNINFGLFLNVETLNEKGKKIPKGDKKKITINKALEKMEAFAKQHNF